MKDKILKTKETEGELIVALDIDEERDGEGPIQHVDKVPTAKPQDQKKGHGQDDGPIGEGNKGHEGRIEREEILLLEDETQDIEVLLGKGAVNKIELVEPILYRNRIHMQSFEISPRAGRSIRRIISGEGKLERGGDVKRRRQALDPGSEDIAGIRYEAYGQSLMFFISKLSQL
jgi:hypothetical protein